ncbi:hypothetical protein RKD32_005552 [Streptomyces sp. SAI-195]
MSVRSVGNARVGRLEKEAGALRESAGAGAVAGNLTSALLTLSGSVPVPVIPLLTYRAPAAAPRRRRPVQGVPHCAWQKTTRHNRGADESGSDDSPRTEPFRSPPKP